MVTIIETNIIKDGDVVHDIQSRVIQAESWEKYRKDLINEISVSYMDIVGTTNGFTLPKGIYKVSINLDKERSLVATLRKKESHYQFQKMAYLALDESKCMYKIYAGLNGGFGGATYQETKHFESQNDAEFYALELACEIFERYAGRCYGVRSIEEIMNEEHVDVEEANYIYMDERDGWLDYHVELAEN